MHQIHRIQEILSNIFGHLIPTERYWCWTEDRRCSTATLAALARTCRTFKEPALDVLWSELVCLTPLARCIPQACSVNRGYLSICYSFRRRPNDAEWEVLRSYTKRIRKIYCGSRSGRWLDYASLAVICTPPAISPLFPNIRILWLQGNTFIPAVHIAVPSLTSLTLRLTPGTRDPELNDFLETVVAHCPNIKILRFHLPPLRNSNEIFCRHIRRLTNLQEIYCHGINLDVDTFTHLSQMPSFRYLSYLPFEIAHVPDGTLSSGTVSAFLSLTSICVKLPLLERITEFLSYIRLPIAERLEIDFGWHPSKVTFGTFSTTVQNVCSVNFLAHVDITCDHSPLIFRDTRADSVLLLTLDDIYPFKAYINFQHVHIDLKWSVNLTDSDLVALVSAWPRLHTLIINDQWGWRTKSGITLRGLLQLLQMRRTLSKLCIAIRADSYTDLPHGYETELLPPPNPLMINFADSTIQTADVPALVDVFVKLELRTDLFLAWDGKYMNRVGAMGYKDAWSQVFTEVEERLTESKFLNLFTTVCWDDPDPFC